MKKNIKWVFIISALVIIGACKKSEFLDKKPSTSIVTPATLSDFQSLLDNTEVMGYTGGMAQVASDDYFVDYADWQTASATERNSYIWAKDIYAGDLAISDWNSLYQQVFYANSVLDGLLKSGDSGTSQGQYLKGWALFIRAYAFYDLTRNFCKAYDAGTAASDFGIPIRLSSGIDHLAKRSTLQQTFDQIFNDLTAAIPLLPEARPSANLNRPSRIAAYALMARIYLDMRNYPQAEAYADKCLSLYHTLIDYNQIDTITSTPFTTTNDELIFNGAAVVGYLFAEDISIGKINPSVISLFASQDLRLVLFFEKQSDGSYLKKRSYYGAGHTPFTGLATDEQYLIKAECLARKGKTSEAMDELNALLITRYSNATPFIPRTAASSQEALTVIIEERRKELIWRGLRWHDLKRLNKEGANITLTRTLNGVNYILPPNDPRYVFPIPNDEITLSGITQNNR